MILGIRTSRTSAFVLDSSGSLNSVYLINIEFILEDAYWYSLLPPVIIMTAISTSHKILSSYAFFSRPAFLLLNVIYKRCIDTMNLLQELRTADLSITFILYSCYLNLLPPHISSV